MAAIIVRGHAALVTQIWLRARALTVVRQCGSIRMTLKRSDFMLESHTAMHVILHEDIQMSTHEKRSLYLLFTWFWISISFWWHPFNWRFKSFVQVLCKKESSVTIRKVNQIDKSQKRYEPRKGFFSSTVSTPGLRVLSASLSSMVSLWGELSLAENSEGWIRANGSLFSGEVMM